MITEIKGCDLPPEAKYEKDYQQRNPDRCCGIQDELFRGMLEGIHQGTVEENVGGLIWRLL